MTTFQTVVKYLAMALAICLIIGIVGGLVSTVGLFTGFHADDAVLEEMKTYSVGPQIRTLEVSISAADFVIKQADAFAVESNLKYLSVSEKNGTLTIREERKGAATYTDSALTLYIPAGAVLEEINIMTGAAKLTADTISADTVKLQLGAGDVHIGHFYAASKADVEGGAGRITVDSGSIRNLELEMGIGELNLTAALLGSSDLNFGVGASNLTLLGGKDDYRLDLEKGIGNITVEGKSVSDYGSSGSGEHRVEIEGGIGAIHVMFRDAA